MSDPTMQCRHVFTDGHRCASPCLRHEPFCYYHHTSRRPVENLAARRRRGATFTLPELDSRAALQLALGEILQRIASNDLDPRRAGHLLYGLQIAATLLPKDDPKKKPAPYVAEVTHDDQLGTLAPAQQVGADREPSPWDDILNELDERKKAKAAAAESESESAPKPFDLDTIPSLDAVASPTSEPKTLNPDLLHKSAFAQRRKKTPLSAPLLATHLRRSRAETRRSPQVSVRTAKAPA